MLIRSYSRVQHGPVRKGVILKYSVLLLMMIASGQGLAETESESIYGYVRDINFYPLVSLEGHQFRVLTNSHAQIPEIVEPLIQTLPANALQLTSSENYIDRYGQDTIGTFGKMTPVKQTTPFFYKNVNSAVVEFSKDTVARKSFYKFFSNDNWGRHFISKAQLSLSLPTIAKVTDINIHAVTDINEDGRKEIWASYKLMYGEIGAMVYEQGGSEGWKELVNHCFQCD